MSAMDKRVPLDRLTEQEASKTREIIDAEGKRQALILFGLRDMCAMMKAAAGFDVHRLTVIYIRAALARRP
jgi:hypothetical protein